MTEVEQLAQELLEIVDKAEEMVASHGESIDDVIIQVRKKIEERLPIEYRKDPEKVKELFLAQFPLAIDFADESILNDELIEFAIENRYCATMLSPEIITSNPNYISMMLETFADAIEVATGPAFNKENLDKAISKGYRVSEYTPSSMRSNPKLIAYLITHGDINAIALAEGEALNPQNIELAISTIKDRKYNQYKLIGEKRDLVIMMIKAGCPELLDSVSNKILDTEIVRCAIEAGYIPTSSTPSKITNNREFCQMFIEVGRYEILENMPSEYLTPDLIYQALTNGYIVDKYPNQGFLNVAKKDGRCITALLKQGIVELIDMIDDNFLTEENIMIAIYKGYKIGHFTPSIIKNTPKYIIEIIKRNDCNVISLLKEEQITEEMVLVAIEHGYKIGSRTPNYIKENPKFIKKYIEKGYPEVINIISPSLLTDDVVLAAIERGYHYDYETPEEIKGNPLYLKRVLERGYTTSLDFAAPEALTEENVLLAIYQGYHPNKSTPREVLTNPTYIKALLAKGEFDILQYAHSNTLNRTIFTTEDFERYFENITNIVKTLKPDNNMMISYMLEICYLYHRSPNKTPDLDMKAEYILECVRHLTTKRFGNKELVDRYISKVFSGQSKAIRLSNIDSLKNLAYVINFTDIVSRQAAELNNGVTMTIIEKSNKKQLRKIIEMLRAIPVGEEYLPMLATNIYVSIGYTRATDLLTGKYGPIDEEKLLTMFKNIVPSGVLFESEGKGFRPVLNEVLLNLVFGANYKIQNTAIRNYLNSFQEREAEFLRMKQKVQMDMSLSADEKSERIARLSEQYESYVEMIHNFMPTFSNIFNSWDIMQEEFLKSTAKSSLKLKMSLDKVLELSKIIDAIKNTPKLEARDEPLARSNVFEYAYHDTQFVSDVKQVPDRLITLSRRMDLVEKKKFPNITMSRGEYTIKVYGPQDRNILSAGYRSKCCFRACGNADNSGNDNSLLNYCVSTEYGGGVEIVDSKGDTVMFSPILRNGNVVMIHSVETIRQSNLPPECYELLQQFSEEMIKEARTQGDDISFVTITDLHFFDNKYSKGSLPYESKFSVFDEEQKFKGIYTNLTCNHMILANREGATLSDIKYEPVEHAYSFDLPSLEFMIQMSEQDAQFIWTLDELKKEYMSLANERAIALQKGDEARSYELLAQIKQAKDVYLKEYKRFIESKGSKDMFSDYSKAVSFVSSLNKDLGIDMDISELGISDILCGPDWYIIITRDSKIIANSLPSGKEKLVDRLRPLIPLREIETIDSNTLYEEYSSSVTL